MTIIPCGTNVTIKLNKQEATITAIEIRFKQVIYQLSYFNGNGEHQTDWLDSSLFTASDHSKIKIGFVK